MHQPYKIKITVHSITNGECSDGFKVGDSWLIENDKTPAGLCELAYHALYSSMRVLKYGGDYSGEYESKSSVNSANDVKYVCCPDSKHMVVFEVRRFR